MSYVDFEQVNVSWEEGKRKYDAIAEYFPGKWDKTIGEVPSEIYKRKLKRGLFKFHISFIFDYLDKNADFKKKSVLIVYPDILYPDEKC